MRPEEVAAAIATFAFELVEREVAKTEQERVLRQARWLLDQKMLELREDAQTMLDERHREGK